MRIVSTTGASSLQYDGVTYERADGDSAFDVPENVGEDLVRFPHWVREYQADPSATAMDERLRALEAQAAAQAPGDGEAALMARVAELEAQLAEATQPKPAAAAKKTAAKKTAAPRPAQGDGEDAAPGGGDTEDDASQ